MRNADAGAGIVFPGFEEIPVVCVEMPCRGKYGRQLGIVVGIEIGRRRPGRSGGRCFRRRRGRCHDARLGGALSRVQHVGFGVHVLGTGELRAARQFSLCDLMRDVPGVQIRHVGLVQQPVLLLRRGQVGVEHQAGGVTGTEERPGCRPRHRGAERRPDRHRLELRARQTHHDATAVGHGHLLPRGFVAVECIVVLTVREAAGLTCRRAAGFCSAGRQRFLCLFQGRQCGTPQSKKGSTQMQEDARKTRGWA